MKTSSIPSGMIVIKEAHSDVSGRLVGLVAFLGTAGVLLSMGFAILFWIFRGLEERSAVSAALIYLLPGGIFAWVGCVQIKDWVQCGRQEAFISDVELQPGRDFEFCFRQICKGYSKSQSVEIYLVFRETIEVYRKRGIHYGLHRETSDRLVIAKKGNSRIYERGDWIEERVGLRIPPHQMGIQSEYRHDESFKAKTSWIIKVGINDGKPNRPFTEYELNCPDATPSQ